MDNQQEILINVETLAELLFTKEEIYEIIEFENYEKIPGFKQDFNQSYKKGKFTRMVKLRKSLLQLADNGSHPALEKAFILFDKQNSLDV